MNHISIKYYHSPLGAIILGSYRDRLVLCDWQHRKMRAQIDKRIQEGLGALYVEEDSYVLQDTIKELGEYFTGERKEFEVSILLVGSRFQKSVWNALLVIPFGKTMSYLELSKYLGNEKAIRAVANANGANAISIIVPCHRVIGSKGSLTGYAGGLAAKKKLLIMEGINGNQLELFEDIPK